MVAAKGWREEETLEIVRRNYAAKLWDLIQQPPLDSEPLVFPGTGKWKDQTPCKGFRHTPIVECFFVGIFM